MTQAEQFIKDCTRRCSNETTTLGSYDHTYHEWLTPEQALAAVEIAREEILDTLEVKEVQEETESIWHDANQQPTMYRKYLVRYSDGRVSGSWERHDDGFIPWKDVVKEHGFTHWCYVEDLVKL